MGKERDISIDILKFFAVILITNSHMELLYGKYSVLATGGAIGDVLFFFCSGFTLFLCRMGRFDNWYKRRINRIYPTVFAWAILSTLLFSNNKNIIDIIFYGGGWFVSCIMIYYLILYFVRKFMIDKLKYSFLAACCIIIIWYLFIDNTPDYNMYGNTYFKWGHYFLFMLLGANIGISNGIFRFKFKTDFIKLIVSIMLFYGILFLGKKFLIIHNTQIISLIPLLGITFYFYKLCNSNEIKKLYYNKYAGPVIKAVGGLCLEAYLVQSSLFTDKMNNLFPLNLLIMLFIIIAVAYVLRCMARIFSQTFKDGEYAWKAVFKLY